MTRTQEDPLPASNWFSSILRQTRSATISPSPNSDSESKPESDSHSSPVSEPTPCSPGRPSKTRAKSRLTRPLVPRSSFHCCQGGRNFRQEKLKAKLAKAPVRSKNVFNKTLISRLIKSPDAPGHTKVWYKEI